MREAVRNREFTFSLPTKGLFFGERALQEALNDIGQDVSKLVAQNEVESWQRLTRVLTHEIMNATTPIQSRRVFVLSMRRVLDLPVSWIAIVSSRSCRSLFSWMCRLVLLFRQ